MKILKPAAFLFIFLVILTGVVYPGLITLIGQLAFPYQASGSLIRLPDGKLSGSALIGQPFSGPQYFWSRPSATSDSPYNALASGGSNLGPTNPDLLKQVGDRVSALQASGLKGPAPADLVLASGSGLDPHITLETALLQVPRVAEARRLSAARVRQLVQDHLEDRQLGFLGVPRLNVVRLNLALDKLEKAHAP
jgi:K+-transporting ATPase ATPase C chain